MAHPKVHINCAVSADGRLAAPDGSPVLLSCPEDLARVHAMRAACDAILIGIETVLADDPSLRVKPEFASGEDPLRIVLDREGRTPPWARVMNDEAPTLIVTGPKATTLVGVHQARVKSTPEGLDLDELLDHLGKVGIASVMVEGGARVLASFAKRPWDSFTVYVSPDVLGDGPKLWSASPDELGFAWTEAALGPGRLLSFSRE